MAAPETPARRRSPVRLSRSLIADVALEALASRDADINSLSTTSIAARLGVARSAISRYVTGRDDLLRALADRAFERSASIPAAGDWRHYLLAVADWVWAIYGDHPGLKDVVVLRLWPPPRQMSHFILDRARYLVLQGFSIELAILAVDLVFNHAAETSTTAARFADADMGWEEMFDENEVGAVAPDMIAEFLIRRGDSAEDWARGKLDVILDGIAYRRGLEQA